MQPICNVNATNLQRKCNQFATTTLKNMVYYTNDMSSIKQEHNSKNHAKTSNNMHCTEPLCNYNKSYNHAIPTIGNSYKNNSLIGQDLSPAIVGNVFRHAAGVYLYMKGATMLMLAIAAVFVGLIVFATYRNSRLPSPTMYTPEHNFPTLLKESPYHQVDYTSPQFTPDPRYPTLVKEIPAVNV